MPRLVTHRFHPPSTLTNQAQTITTIQRFLFCSDTAVDGIDISFTADASDPTQTRSATKTAYAYYSTQPLHSAFDSLNMLSNVMLQTHVSDSNARIFTYNHPLPASLDDELDELRKDATGLNLAIFMAFGGGFLLASYIVFVVVERITKAKHVQFVSGVSVLMYWTSSFLFDLLTALLPALLIVIIFAAFNVPAFQGERLLYVFLLIMMFVFSGLPLTYMLSFAYSTSSSAYARTSMLYILVGLALVLAVFVLGVVELDDTQDLVKRIGMILPNYALAQGVLDMFYNYNYHQSCYDSNGTVAQSCIDKDTVPQDNYLSTTDPGIGLNFIFLFVTGIVYFAITLIIEWSAHISSCGPSAHSNYGRGGWFRGRFFSC